MLCDISVLKGYAVLGSDGRLGTVTDLLFDDVTWKMRWLVVNTRDWLPSHEVLLPVTAWGRLDISRRQFTVRLSRQYVEDSPRFEEHLPVSRQERMDLKCRQSRSAIGSRPRCGDPHLRSIDAVLGHRVHAGDAEIGHVDEILVDSADWDIRYLKVDTRGWRPDRRLLVPPRSIREIDWPGRAVHLATGPRESTGSPYCPAVRADDPHDEILPAGGGISWTTSGRARQEPLR